MAATARPGPTVQYGGGSGSPGRQANTAASPSYDWSGRGILDIRVGWNQTRKGCIGLGQGYFRTLRQAPSAIAGNNIAAAQNATSGTAFTLVSSSGAGITVLAATQQVWASGTIIPINSLAIDLQPALIGFGLADSAGNYVMNCYDPTKAIARAVSILGVTAGSGGNVDVAGWDLYGYPQTERIAVGAGAGTTNGKKGWKFIASVTPRFSDAHNYAVGCADIFEFPIRADNFPDLHIWWNETVITASTGFVAADATAPTNATGSTRGTYAVQSASDGTKILTLAQCPGVTRSATAAGMFGVTPG